MFHHPYLINMKAKTKFQIQIVNLTNKLAPISKIQLSWAKKHCFKHEGIKSKKGIITCLDCGHSFKTEKRGNRCKCPSCGTMLQLIETLKRKFDDWAYFSTIDKLKGYQIIRHFKLKADYKKGLKADISCFEACQIWIDKSGKFEIFGLQHFHNYYFDTWSGAREIRNKKLLHKYDLRPYRLYPKMKLIPELQRSGFDGDFHELTTLTFFRNILIDNKFETLIKANQSSIISHNNLRLINEYWPSIRICIRNSYTVDDASLWFDYLQLLKHFNKDLKNPKFVCPLDLPHEHDKYVEKRRKQRNRLQLEKLKSEIYNSQKVYEQRMSKFFGITFSNGNISISVVKHVRDFFEISESQGHCLFTNEYYNRTNSLIMVATKENEILETIEISLRNFSIIQSRGKFNKKTENHETIIQLVQKNVHVIQKYAS